VDARNDDEDESREGQESGHETAEIPPERLRHGAMIEATGLRAEDDRGRHRDSMGIDSHRGEVRDSGLEVSVPLDTGGGSRAEAEVRRGGEGVLERVRQRSLWGGFNLISGMPPDLHLVEISSSALLPL